MSALFEQTPLTPVIILPVFLNVFILSHNSECSSEWVDRLIYYNLGTDFVTRRQEQLLRCFLILDPVKCTKIALLCNHFSFLQLQFLHLPLPTGWVNSGRVSFNNLDQIESKFILSCNNYTTTKASAHLPSCGEGWSGGGATVTFSVLEKNPKCFPGTP